jgi:predicted RNA-binding protein YlqC (UPF0109 family)
VTEAKAKGRTRKTAAEKAGREATAAEAPPEVPDATAATEANGTEAPQAPPVPPEPVPAAGPPAEFTLEQCVEFVLRAIVQNQEALTIVRKDEPDKVRISVAVAPEDLGKVIGKQGRTINALRTVVKTAAARTDTQVVVDLEGKAV